MFIRPWPSRHQTFQWVYAPLIRNEFSINELTELLLNGVENRPPDDKLLNKLFGAGILPRPTEEEMLKQLFRVGIFVTPHNPTQVRRQIIKWLKRDLRWQPTDKEYGWLSYVKYAIDGMIVPVSMMNVDGIKDDEPIRIICRPKWFDDNGSDTKNPENKYYGGRVKRGGREGQEEFYGKDGTGGRFPLRRLTPLPSDVT